MELGSTLPKTKVGSKKVGSWKQKTPNFQLPTSFSIFKIGHLRALRTDKDELVVVVDNTIDHFPLLLHKRSIFLIDRTFTQKVNCILVLLVSCRISPSFSLETQGK